jgi:hypothetical protein
VTVRPAGQWSSCHSGWPVLVTARPADLLSAGDCWQSWVLVLLLVDPLLQCSHDVSVAMTDVTDASMLEARIFILLSLGGAWTNGHWSCHGERWLDSARFTVGGSHNCPKDSWGTLKIDHRYNLLLFLWNILNYYGTVTRSHLYSCERPVYSLASNSPRKFIQRAISPEIFILILHCSEFS